jgi:hypothetical protein
MFASAGNNTFVTFSEAAAASALASGKDPATAAATEQFAASRYLVRALLHKRAYAAFDIPFPPQRTFMSALS